MTLLLLDNQQDLSQMFDETVIQESWGWRNVTTARALACQVIDDKGKVDRKSLFKIIENLQQALYTLLPERLCDSPRIKHLLHSLKALYENKEFETCLQRVKLPVQHEGALKLIRETLCLTKGQKLTDAHAKRAALSALLTYLRQNVGSCFATAPAIMIQQSQPLQFMDDISQLFGIGALRRVIEGVEFAAPLSATAGIANLYLPFYPHLLGKDPLSVLAKAPGLKVAFKAAGVKGSLSELLKKSFKEQLSAQSFFTLTAADVIEKVLLDSHKLQQEEVKSFQVKQAKGAFYQMYSPNAQIENYLKAYKEAKTAFVSLTENVLLKAWEFTLASFSEAKADFTKWNLYASLGLMPEEPGGIGQNLQRILSEKVDKINQKLAELQSRYDHTFAQVKMMEGRMQNAQTEKELTWLRMDYQMRRHDLTQVMNEQEKLYDRGTTLTSIYPFLLKFYTQKFADYFQEVYDAEMQDLSKSLYDDSPAGFRLLYKHGRSNTTLWSLIYTPQEFISALNAFFVGTEVELSSQKEVKILGAEVTELVSAIIATIGKSDFLEGAFQRLAKSYGQPLIENPLENLDRVERKPWAYISGGTMETLVNAYYCRNSPLTMQKKWVESELELLVFYLDSLKDLKLSIANTFSNSENSLLAFSPTHAFLLKPGTSVFKQGWQNDAYTYSWVRDYWIVPAQAFLDQTKLFAGEVGQLTEKLLSYLPEIYHSFILRALMDLPSQVTAPYFRDHLMQRLKEEKALGKALSFIGETLDAIFYNCLPFFGQNELYSRLKILFESIDEIEGDAALSYLDEVKQKAGSLLSSADLSSIALNLLQKWQKKESSYINFPLLLQTAMQKLQFTYPAPIIFGDTNWVKKRFGFIVGPATEKLELWTFDELGLQGKPFTLWNHYLNGQIKQEWGIYINPEQYTPSTR